MTWKAWRFSQWINREKVYSKQHFNTELVRRRGTSVDWFVTYNQLVTFLFCLSILSNHMIIPLQLDAMCMNRPTTIQTEHSPLIPTLQVTKFNTLLDNILKISCALPVSPIPTHLVLMNPFTPLPRSDYCGNWCEGGCTLTLGEAWTTSSRPERRKGSV